MPKYRTITQLLSGKVITQCTAVVIFICFCWIQLHMILCSLLTHSDKESKLDQSRISSSAVTFN